MIALELPQIQYTTVTRTRKLSVDLPYCEPRRGAPYGEKNGPAIALVGAAGSIGAGLSVGGFVGGLMIAGGIASAIGGLTGNETLSMLGTGLSLAGGIGTAFVNQAGNFVNPFTTGSFLDDTVMGGAFKGVKNFFSDVTGGSAAKSLGMAGDDIVAGVSDVIPDVSASTMTKDLISSAPKTGIDVMKSGALDSAGLVASGAGKSTGLLGAIGQNKDLLNIGVGVADGYSSYLDRQALAPVRDAQVTNLNANAAATTAATQLQQDRYDNMQAQPAVNIGVNDNAEVFNRQPGSAPGKYAVVMNGEVKYVTQAEYDAIRSQSQTQGGGGLLATAGA
jgi:hypothetical protein